jgi:hypothetical protein
LAAAASSHAHAAIGGAIPLDAPASPGFTNREEATGKLPPFA